MRRKRQLPTVQLFPFLSVLLCTLGALILLLLVLDQKSRQANADEAARAAAEKQRDRDSQRDAAQRLRLEALRRLEAERADAAKALNAAREHEERQARLLELRKQELADAHTALDRERARLALLEDALRAGRGDATQLNQERSKVNEQLAILLAETRALERLVKQLEEANQAKRQVRYSLIPYKGKQATKRLPIYLECAGATAHFQPNGERLKLDDFLPEGAFRGLVEHKAKQRGGDARPYLLILIRPSGIRFYYAAIHALKDSEVDIGYELIGEDWALEFNDPEKPPPEIVEGPSIDPKAPGSPLGTPRIPGTDGGGKAGHAGVWPPPAVGWPGYQPGRPTYSPGKPGTGVGPATANNSGDPGRNGGAGSEHGGPSPGRKPNLRDVVARLFADESPRGPGQGTATKPNDPQPPRDPGGNSEHAGKPGEPHDPKHPGDKTGSGPHAKVEGEGKTKPAPDLVSILPPKAPPPPEATADDTPLPERGVGSTTPPDEKPHSKSGEPAPAVLNPDRGIGLPQPVRPVPTLDARSEWEIVIECRADRIVVTTLKKEFDIDGLTKGDSPLLQTLRSALDLRRKGVPELQARVKFIILPDGLRTYYAAADAIAPLKLPAKWVILEREEPRPTIKDF